MHYSVVKLCTSWDTQQSDYGNKAQGVDRETLWSRPLQSGLIPIVQED